ncbi:tether containing UBX domain for GLUT4-like [Daktulosphaira vitifoliae]|uniref:tether containing UBX domain for GLUT4-like n=1 Tax=Daktulosphaira vitifoliae TaxID=58002 RepID=UPI0021A99B17|nr:tether containing UBX domain for GLUT4-like [Daktulosphaira vitifoliae]
MTTNLVVSGNNGMRIPVKVNPNMSILNVLELACTKMKVDYNNYDLKYHNKILDSTSILRFSNIANNAILELVPTTKSKLKSIVVIWLQLEDGLRLSGEFTPDQNLWEVVQSILKDKVINYESPTIIYTRIEIIGKDKLQNKTLKDLGLINGKALLRFLNKKELVEQAHVYVPAERKPKIEEKYNILENSSINQLSNIPELKQQLFEKNEGCTNFEVLKEQQFLKKDIIEKSVVDNTHVKNEEAVTKLSNEDLNNFKASIKYLDERETLLFNIMDGTSVIYKDEEDDFFEPTIRDVTLVFRDLKNYRSQLDDGQLCTNAMKELEKTQNQLNILHKYKKCIVRIHFPDRLVLQSVFKPTDSIGDVTNFIRKYLINESMDFHLFTAPPKTILKEKKTLLEYKCVPSAMIHFSSEIEGGYLKPGVLENIVSANQASIAAYLVSKERKNNEINTNTENIGIIQDPHDRRHVKEEQKIKPKWFKFK